jgi:lycopene beta-cyclase
VNSINHYDYIICGGGCAGLSLAHRFCLNRFKEKRILIIDKTKKDSNDRTWCSWVKEADLYSSVAVHHWPEIGVHTHSFEKKTIAAPYQYRMIRGLDFYSYVNKIISEQKNIQIVHAAILSIEDRNDGVMVKTKDQDYTASIAFKSYIDFEINKGKYNYLDQHFKGYFIKTMKPVFDPSSCELMDFRIDQKDDLRFLYVLPTAKDRALVEVAVFSKNLLSHIEYDEILKSYIEKYITTLPYEIEEEEFGVIPMTDYPFHKHSTKNIVQIGSAGGNVKSSSGYAFTRIQKHCDAIIDCMLKDVHPSKARNKFAPRYRFFDAIFLQVLIEQKGKGYKVFEDLFSKRSYKEVFAFLDEEANIVENIKTMWACNKTVFMKGLWNYLWSKK